MTACGRLGNARGLAWAWAKADWEAVQSGTDSKPEARNPKAEVPGAEGGEPLNRAMPATAARKLRVGMRNSGKPETGMGTPASCPPSGCLPGGGNGLFNGPVRRRYTDLLALKSNPPFEKSTVPSANIAAAWSSIFEKAKVIESSGRWSVAVVPPSA